MITLKRRIYERCRELIGGKMEALQRSLQDLAESAANETKSSAGDKFETSRAMIHIEQDRLRGQIAELAAQQAVLDAINPDVEMSRVAAGSLVKANGAYYFLSVALGRMNVDGLSVIALSMQSPLGIKLKGLRTGDAPTMNGIEMSIEALI